MHYNVPQFIDIEDTIVGPLTAKQLLWLFGMGAVLLLIWFVVREKGVFIMLAIPIALIFGALAFYRPHGQPLVKFIAHALFFFVRPKIYIWKREGVVRRAAERKTVEKRNRVIERKSISQKEIANLAKILDSENEILNK
ncbi:MAG: PrgI family protein [Candidatus Moranbacteria bacterium]|jgi:hypothetical protein|nr:PrgI family protein [Candidatus Moranbacteria bacterium]MDD5652252.1 PrgI family protein [Candidatus Moranbacteria bacterium]MDX9856045.1 PrgI family protein [Candidatus Moranbacteria bacterium]